MEEPEIFTEEILDKAFEELKKKWLRDPPFTKCFILYNDKYCNYFLDIIGNNLTTKTDE